MAEVRCPKCRSTDFTVLGNTGKSLSLGKGIIGGALFGPIGAAGGAILGKKVNTTLHATSVGIDGK